MSGRDRLARNAYMRAWNAAHREQVRAAAIAAKVRDPEASRAQKINSHWKTRGGEGSISGDDLRFIQDRDAGQCVFCGDDTTEVDHDLAPSRGGLNERDNLQLCCRPCNQRKRTLTGAEFRGDEPAYCPAGHPRTPGNRVQRTRGNACRMCERTRWPASPEALSRAAERKRLRLSSDPALVERERAYKRAYRARQHALNK